MNFAVQYNTVYRYRIFSKTIENNGGGGFRMPPLERFSCFRQTYFSHDYTKRVHTRYYKYTCDSGRCCLR